jgi:hypothetical protein
MSSKAGSRIKLVKLLLWLLTLGSPFGNCLFTHFPVLRGCWTPAALGVLGLPDHLPLPPLLPLYKTRWEGTKTRVQVLMRSLVR